MVFIIGDCMTMPWQSSLSKVMNLLYITVDYLVTIPVQDVQENTKMHVCALPWLQHVDLLLCYCNG